MVERSINIGISICVLIIGVILLIAGIGALWTSFTMVEGGMIRPLGILFPIIGSVLIILAIMLIRKNRKQLDQ